MRTPPLSTPVSSLTKGLKRTREKSNAVETLNFTGNIFSRNVSQMQARQKILHIIATRMFCKIRPIHDEEYFKKRLDIFEHFTLPSLTTQTNQNFHWVLLTNPNLKLKTHERLKKLISSHANIHIVYTNITKELHNQKEYETQFNLFLSSINTQAEYFLSSRIDSDDCWNIQYVERLQAEAEILIDNKKLSKDTKGYLLTFPKGVICYPHKIRNKYGLVYCRKRYWSSSVDMLTSFSDRTPLYQFPHSRTRKFAKILKLRRVSIETQNAMWLYLQHSLNYALTDQYKWFRWFKLIEKYFFKVQPLEDSKLKPFNQSQEKINAFNKAFFCK